MKNLLVILFFTFITIKAQAQIFSLEINAADKARISALGGGLGATLFTGIESAITEAENDVNQDLPSNEPKRMMEGMADSSIYSGKGLNSDYITHFDVFTVGAGLGIGADLEKNDEADSDVSGIGVQGGIVAGVNLGKISSGKLLGLDTSRMNLMVNFFKYDLDRDIGDDAEGSFDMMSFGFHLNYKWIEGKGNRIFGWDGVKLHTGYEYNKTKIGFTTTINEVVSDTVGSGATAATFGGTITGAPEGSIDVKTHSIPLEISTGVNFLYVMSLYGGLGADINSGEAKGSADLNADESTLTCTGGTVCGGGGESVRVTPKANLDFTGKVTPFTSRAFLGLQFSVPFVRIFVQANKGIGTDMASVATGLRLAF